ncbi:AIPR family protein [Thalassospira indica]|uniref:Abortive phage infection protein n=1 Tax=Thalassospira indica TaxID=1891279 RepID=A0ABN5NBU4_9PROT|nr:AIPR family protein [Thalassospira indica]AXO12868.1 abortive phage infection protein [Thalassospira indica]OAZ15296.1 hypothetical protein TH15_05860 [Thalassospira profundimaris]
MADLEIVDLERFQRDFVQEVIARADAHEEGALREDELTQVFIEYLVDIGEIEDAEISYHQARGVKANGFYVSEDGDRLDLFVTDARLTEALESVTKTDVDTAFKRVRSFLEKALDGYHKSLEEASDGYDMAWAIWSSRRDLVSARLFLVTDGLTKIEAIEDFRIGEIEISHHVWDLRRLYRADVSNAGHEPIKVNFEDLTGQPLRCLAVPQTSEKYRCFMSMLTGQTIVDLYLRHGPRLLERNVRSFLQLRGDVNKGIRKTIQEESDMFVAYNNGLSIVVRGVTGEENGIDNFEISSTDDFQIVNGGQTTGSIYRAATKDKYDISKIFIPVKITEITGTEYVDEVAPKISLFANSQNKVNKADFTSNDPFHVKLEEVSRKTWAPPKRGLQKQTRWFFERARGQYLDSKTREGTPARQKAWEAINPRRQMFTKTDLGKFENAWSQLPQIVARGAQKSFLYFMAKLDERGGIEVDEEYFRRLVAKAILFKETERIVTRQKFGGYRSQIVAYSLALLSHCTAQRVDLEEIWESQDLPEALAAFIEEITVLAHKHITNAPNGQNIGEWCKKDLCWERFRETELDVPEAISKGLSSRPANRLKKGTHTADAPSSEEAALIDAMAHVPADTWFGISSWAKETHNLQGWQRSLSFSLGHLASQGRKPSRKQAVQGQKILSEAQSLGFAVNQEDA